MKSHGIKLLLAVTLFALLLTACSAGQPAGSGPEQGKPSGNVSSQEPASSANGNDSSNTDHTAPINETDPLDTSDTAPVVYFTSDISPEGLMAVYEALAWTPTGNAQSSYLPVSLPQATICGRS